MIPIQNLVNETITGFRSILFPGVCVACGEPVPGGTEMLCPFCQVSGFESANLQDTTSCAGVILPDRVRFQFALWKYDKGGMLQSLLHGIKYNGLGKLGFELGILTGNALRKHTIWQNIFDTQKVVLLPVPLHHRRKRMRGFNQAEVIALGISQALGIPLLPEMAVIRRRYTKTQTGFSLTERNRNLKEAFEVRMESALEDCFVIVVDDVFTTGATCFSLIEAVAPHTRNEFGIMTVAFA